MQDVVTFAAYEARSGGGVPNTAVLHGTEAIGVLKVLGLQ